MTHEKKERVLPAREQQTTAAQTKGARRRETYGDKEGESKKSKTMKKQGTNARKSCSRLKASIVTKLPSLLQSRAGDLGHSICHLPALVDNGIECHYCRCRAPPSREKINEKLWSPNRDTEIHCNAVSRVDNAMTCNRSGYDRYDMQMLAIQMR